MRQNPIQPVVRLGLARVLNEHFGMRGPKAVATATKIIELLRDQGMDIVKGDWMAGPLTTEKRFRWEDIGNMVAEMESEGYTPWKNPELQ